MRDRGEDRRPGDGWRTVTWDPRTPNGAWTAELEGAHAIVHLSGRRVDTRATRRNVDELIHGVPRLGGRGPAGERRLLEEGFEFEHPDFEPVARQALERVGAL